MCSIRILAKNIGDLYYELFTIPYDNYLCSKCVCYCLYLVYSMVPILMQEMEMGVRHCCMLQDMANFVLSVYYSTMVQIVK